MPAASAAARALLHLDIKTPPLSDLIGGSARRRSVRAHLSEAGLRKGTRLSDRKRRVLGVSTKLGGGVSEVRRRAGRRASRGPRRGGERNARSLPSRGRGASPGRADRDPCPA